jgi:DNA repair exonuclease SbcCD ATPase subunit
MDDIGQKREDEWFRKNEEQLIAAARVAREKRERERAEQEKAEERKRLKEAHYMKCPKCGHDLKEEAIEAVKVDRCTFCEGLFLDAGELEALFLKREEERKGLLKRLLKI